MKSLTKTAIALFAFSSRFAKITASPSRGSLGHISDPNDNIEVQLHFGRAGSRDESTVKTLQLSKSHHFTNPRSSDVRDTLTALVGVYEIEPSLAKSDTIFFFTSAVPESEIFCFLIYWSSPRSYTGLEMLSASVKEREMLVLNENVRAVECRDILWNG